MSHISPVEKSDWHLKSWTLRDVSSGVHMRRTGDVSSHTLTVLSVTLGAPASQHQHSHGGLTYWSQSNVFLLNGKRKRLALIGHNHWTGPSEWCVPPACSLSTWSYWPASTGPLLSSWAPTPGVTPCHSPPASGHHVLLQGPGGTEDPQGGGWQTGSQCWTDCALLKLPKKTIRKKRRGSSVRHQEEVLLLVLHLQPGRVHHTYRDDVDQSKSHRLFYCYAGKNIYFKLFIITFLSSWLLH